MMPAAASVASALDIFYTTGKVTRPVIGAFSGICYP